MVGIVYMHHYHDTIGHPLKLREYLRMRRTLFPNTDVYLPMDAIWYRKPVARTEFANVIAQANGG